MTIIVTLTATPITASTIISRAMRLIKQLGSGESPTTNETADCLVALNDMLDTWRNEKLMCYATLDESLTMVSGQSSYSVGLGGDMNTNRPTKIDRAYIVDSSGSSFDVNILNAEEYAAIGLKSSQSTWPQYIYYAPDIPLGNLYVYPVPNAASTLHLLTPTPVLAFATSATTAYLPPGWSEAMSANLAVAIAPEFETEASPTVMGMARNSKAGIKRTNMQPTKMYTELPRMMNNPHQNIITGE